MTFLSRILLVHYNPENSIEEISQWDSALLMLFPLQMIRLIYWGCPADYSPQTFLLDNAFWKYELEAKILNMHFLLLQDMLQYHMLLGRMTHKCWVSLPLALLFLKQFSVMCSEPNQQCDSSCLHSLAKERVNYKKPLLLLSALASHTLTSSVTSGAVTDPC